MSKHCQIYLGLITAIIVLLSCGTVKSETDSDSLLILKDSITVNKIGTLTDVPTKHRNRLYYIDKKSRTVFYSEGNFENPQILIKKGQDKENIAELYDVSIAGDLLFVEGSPELVVFDISSDAPQFIGKYAMPFNMASKFFATQNQIGVFGIDVKDFSEQSTFALFTFSFDKQKGITNIQKRVSTEPSFKVDNIFLSGHVVTDKGKITFIFDWLGEYFVIDEQKYSIAKKGKLPFYGNVQEFENSSTEKPPYYQAYGVSQYHNKIIVLRELDFEGNDITRQLSTFGLEGSLRKRLQIFDSNFKLLKSTILPFKAARIGVMDNKLYALDLNNNTTYIYEIKGF
jgi:hypothetical protein